MQRKGSQHAAARRSEDRRRARQDHARASRTPRREAKPTGDSDVKLGAAYLSYGENDKAIEALQRGIGKGGVKDPDEAGLLLGIAYLRRATRRRPRRLSAP